MTITAENIRDDVVAALGNRTDLDENRIYRQIHFAQLRIARLRKWRELDFETTFTLAAGDGVDIAFSGASASFTYREIRAIESILLVRASDADAVGKLRRVSTAREWDRLKVTMGDITEQRQPQYYNDFAMKDDELNILPVADEAYTLEWKSKNYPAEITTSNKTNALTLQNADDAMFQLSLANIAGIARDHKTRRQAIRDYSFIVEEIKLEDADQGDMDQAAVRRSGQDDFGPDYWADPFNQTHSHEQVR